MNYDTVIVEMLSRIQALEEKVELLSRQIEGENAKTPDNENVKKTTTADIREYIESLIASAADDGKSTITLKASDIHNGMNLSKRYPMVCNAMRQCMKSGDTVDHETASGYSSTLEITYQCIDRGGDND